MSNINSKETIIALSTAQGAAAIALLRISGPAALAVLEPWWYSNALFKKSTGSLIPRMQTFGAICQDGKIVDEVLVTFFKGPNSYTGEDSIEITCHGSSFIRQKLLQLLLSSGARMAEPGEFTERAFLNGKMDLSQAEAVIDLINSQSAVSHEIAMKQMRGGFSNVISELRESLIHFASLIELELDFSEEDVEFADRSQLKELIKKIRQIILGLLKSFELGNVIKDGIPVAIIGKPNAGKSTLLNALLNEERAIVSEIPGTTRDTIEDQLVIEGIAFRFIDTAGIRQTNDRVEQIGVERAYTAMRQAAIVLYLFDPLSFSATELAIELKQIKTQSDRAKLLVLANKADLQMNSEQVFQSSDYTVRSISAKEKIGIDDLKSELLRLVNQQIIEAGDVIVTNARHAAALEKAAEALNKIENAMENGVPGDLLALDIRFALDQLGNITGRVTSEDLLYNIFSRFCIGK